MVREIGENEKLVEGIKDAPDRQVNPPKLGTKTSILIVRVTLANKCDISV